MGQNIVVIGGGTVSHVRNHLALCAPAYGTTAREIGQLCHQMNGYQGQGYDIRVFLTKMAGGNDNFGHGVLETNQDVSNLTDQLIADPRTKIIFFNPALVDYDGAITVPSAVGYEWAEVPTPSGKYQERLQTSKGEQTMLLWPAEKILKKIRKTRKDIFLVAFKTTCGASEDEQFLTGLHLLKSNSCNLVLANDTKTRNNMVITPEQARYFVTEDREAALKGLVQMTVSRAQGTFTRSTVVSGEPISWTSDQVPASLRQVVDHCIEKGAYKPFNGSTVGHFAFKVSNNLFVTSKRKTDFNQLNDVGMVLCESEDDNSVVAFGAKPSVGGQSQRIIFRQHPDVDCIVHFHCPPKPTLAAKTLLSTRSQMQHECGSHQCGQNTSDGLQQIAPGIKCVYLDNHGPNIVFNHQVDPQKVINFIDLYFDLSRSTDQVDRSQIQVQ